MKKLIKRSLPVLLGVFITLTLAACGGGDAETSPPASPSGSASTPVATPPVSTSPSQYPSSSPSPSPTPSATPSPPPPVNGTGSLELSEYYYYDGLYSGSSLHFYSDGTFEADSGDGDILEGTYTVVGDRITCEVDGEEEYLNIVDEYTLESDYGELFIREGGVGFIGGGFDPSNLPPIVFDEYYYLEHDMEELTLYFWDDGDVELGYLENHEWATYVYDGYDEIKILMDGRVVMVLSIINDYTLENSHTGVLYILDGGGQSDPGDTDKNEWWGIYAKDDDTRFVLEITEVDDEEFWVDIIQLREPNDIEYIHGLTSLSEIGDSVDYNIVTYGWAEIEDANALFAMLNDIGLSLYEDYSALDLFADEDTEWEYMRGQYFKLN